MKKETKLARVINEAQCRKARMTAAEKLTDQNLILQILEKTRDEEIRFILAKILTDTDKAQRILTEFARHAKDWKVRKAAVEKLTYQPVLREIAKLDENLDVKTAAIRNFDENSLQLVPEIVEAVFSVKEKYSDEKVKYFIQSAYKISQQEQRQVLCKYNGKVLSHSDFYTYTDIPFADYTDYYGDGGYTYGKGEGHSNHTDRPEVTIYF
jgi:hypothetical protein